MRALIEKTNTSESSHKKTSIRALQENGDKNMAMLAFAS
jgi:hypothetical protein